MSIDSLAAAQAALMQGLIKSGLVRPLVSYADVSASTLFTYDYLLTLPMEIELMWTSRWNAIKILFLLQRYLPFIDTCFLTLYRQFGHVSLEACRLLPYYNGFLYMLGFALSETLLSIRVWALWDRNQKLTWIMPIAFTVIFAPGFYTMYLYVSSLRFILSPIHSTRGCTVVAAREIVIWSWVSLLVWNTVTLALTIAHNLRIRSMGISNSRLANIIYRDGTYYYIYLFTFSLLNIFFTTQLQPAKRVIMLSIERCMHSLIASRVLLHMRAQAKRPAHEPHWSALNNTTRSMTTRSMPGTHLHSKGSFKYMTDSGYVMHLRQMSYNEVDSERV